MRRRYLIMLTVAVCALLVAIGLTWHHSGGDQDMAVEQMSSGMRRAALTADGDGGKVVYEVTWSDGRVERMSADEYARRLYASYRSQGLAYRLMNVESTAGVVWVMVGLGGQVLFTGRMVVQWLVSEKNKRSTVPVSFWWMSLGGASMLIAYFLWRWDPVGLLGQAAGWLIYIRNLALIYADGGETNEVGSV